MQGFMIWLSFIGAWLLFAGPIYQATLELQDEDIEADRIRTAGANVPKPPKVSGWWWLVPPIKFLKEFKRQKAYHNLSVKALQREDVEAIVSYRSKALAWLFVAVGGLLLASNETYNLTRYYGWSNLILLALVLGMLILSILNMVVMVKRAEELKNL